MARKLRVYYEGTLDHVIARGNNRSSIFEEKNNKSKDLSIIKEV